MSNKNCENYNNKNCNSRMSCWLTCRYANEDINEIFEENTKLPIKSSKKLNLSATEGDLE